MTTYEIKVEKYDTIQCKYVSKIFTVGGSSIAEAKQKIQKKIGSFNVVYIVMI